MTHGRTPPREGLAMKGIGLAVVGFAVLGVAVHRLHPAKAEDKGDRKVDTRVFELRTYHAAPGKMGALHARFRDHTCRLFRKHGMTVVGFWNPADPGEAQKTLVYLLAYPSKEEADRSWEAFRKDPEWIAVRTASEKEGKVVEKIESVYLRPTDYSPLK
jgi:hypothetical protein